MKEILYRTRRTQISSIAHKRAAARASASCRAPMHAVLPGGLRLKGGTKSAAKSTDRQKRHESTGCNKEMDARACQVASIFEGAGELEAVAKITHNGSPGVANRAPRIYG